MTSTCFISLPLMAVFGKLYRPGVVAEKDNGPSRPDATMPRGEGGFESDAADIKVGELTELDGIVDSLSEVGAVTELNET